MARRRITLFVPGDSPADKNPYLSDKGAGASRVTADAEREESRRLGCYKTAWQKVSRFEKSKGVNRLGQPYGLKLVFGLVLANKANKAYSIAAVSFARKISIDAARMFYERRLRDLEMLFGLERWARWEFRHGSKASEIERERWRHYGLETAITSSHEKKMKNVV